MLFVVLVKLTDGQVSVPLHLFPSKFAKCNCYPFTVECGGKKKKSVDAFQIRCARDEKQLEHRFEDLYENRFNIKIPVNIHLDSVHLGLSRQAHNMGIY